MLEKFFLSLKCNRPLLDLFFVVADRQSHPTDLSMNPNSVIKPNKLRLDDERTKGPWNRVQAPISTSACHALASAPKENAFSVPQSAYMLGTQAPQVARHWPSPDRVAQGRSHQKLAEVAPRNLDALITAAAQVQAQGMWVNCCTESAISVFHRYNDVVCKSMFASVGYLRNN